MFKKKILGVDPGSRITGWGIIESDGHKHQLIEFGDIKTPPKATTAKKYLVIFEELVEVIQKHQPEILSVETQYVHKNIQSAIKLGMARGAIIVAAAQQGMEVFEYTPSKAKKAVTGTGSASKSQVANMMKILLNLNEVPHSEDASDALALAVAHAHEIKPIGL